MEENDKKVIKRLVAVSEDEYALYKKLSKGIGFSGYASEALKEKAVHDLQRDEVLKAAMG
jgi:hypothetical protein